MTPVQIEAVKNSWSKVTPIADQASALFYERLFTLDPSLRALFKPDMAEQRKLLMTMLGTAVAGLDHLDTIVPAIQALGWRHKGYGVAEANYETVGQALLWTLEQGLGEAFTPAVREAWTATFVLVSDTMKTAARAA
ncbi:MAG: globin family protein [Gammaproteobacteria bacterium]